MTMGEEDRVRCFGGPDDLLLMRYHDEEWGVPVHDDIRMFEFLALEGAQAGLSWRTILHKRDAYRQAFHGFDVQRIAAFDETDVQRLLSNSGIVRNRRKIESVISNAKAFLKVQKEFGSFDDYIWAFTGGTVLRRPDMHTWKDVPAKTEESEALSQDLKRRGFRFVGPTICYAHMQAVGMVNDHLVGCFRAPEK